MYKTKAEQISKTETGNEFSSELKYFQLSTEEEFLKYLNYYCWLSVPVVKHTEKLSCKIIPKLLGNQFEPEFRLLELERGKISTIHSYLLMEMDVNNCYRKTRSQPL